MPYDPWNELPSIPDADSLEYRGILAVYGQAMTAIPRFEFGLKCVLTLHNQHLGGTPSPADDAAWERILDGSDKTTLGAR
jgi:hypothetical protein